MTSLPVFLRPRVWATVLDLTQRIAVLSSTTPAVVSEFERGPLFPTYINGVLTNFTRRYGEVANPALSFGHDTVTSAMTQTTNNLIYRVTNGAKYAGMNMVLDEDRKRIIFLPFLTGVGVIDDADTGFPKKITEQGRSELAMLSFSVNPFAPGSTFTMSVSDGTTAQAVSVAYSTDHNQTMTNIAAGIQTALNHYVVGGSATVYIEPTSVAADRWLIFIRVPQTVSLTFIDPEVTGTGSLPVVTLVEDASLADIYAENPGAWANDYGITIGSFNTGVRERYTLTFSQAFVTGNKFGMFLNGTSISEVFDTDSDTTIANIADAIAAHPDVYSATVTEVPGAADNDREILIIAKVAGPSTLTFENVVITGGSSQGVGVVARYLTGVVSDNTFGLNVFHRSNLNTTAEQFTVSFNAQVSGLGVQQNIEYVVNTASTSSINIRVVQRPDTRDASFTLFDSDGNLPSVPTNVIFMNGGDDGNAATAATIRNGWNALADRVNWPCDILLNAGYTSIPVQKTMVALAEKRGDCISILDAPADKQAANTLRLYRINDLDIDSSYATMYTPDVEISDPVTAERRFIPPSGPVGATYAYSDRLTNGLGAPAGLNRGAVPLAIGLRYKYSDADQELLHPYGLNAIMDRKIVGPVVFDEETLQSKQTILSSVHARRILNRVMVGLTDNFEYALFDPNNENTRIQIIRLGDTILGPLKKSAQTVGGLYDYYQQCDSDNNTDDIIDQDAIAYDVYLKISRVAKYMPLRAILTPTGISFSTALPTVSVYT